MKSETYHYYYLDMQMIMGPITPSMQTQEKKRNIVIRSIIKNWMDANHLKINISKMEYVKLGNPRQLGKCISNSINFEDIKIKQADSFKNLGVETDEHFNYQKDIVNRCNKVY